MHQVAVNGFRRGAQAYRRGRPDYPFEAVEWLVEALRIAPGTTVVDVGAGTGKLTAQLVRTGATIVAVEPSDAMRALLLADLPSVVAFNGVAEALPLGTASAEAIVVAQAFHWFDVPSAAAEFHRVLRPDGRLGVVWNERDESVDWVAELNGIVEPYRGAEPRAGSQRNVGLGDLFGPLQNAEFRHAQMIDVAMLTDLVASMSYVAVLPDDERAKVLDRVIALTVRHPAIAGRATFPLSYRTSAFWTERRR